MVKANSITILLTEILKEHKFETYIIIVIKSKQQ